MESHVASLPARRDPEPAASTPAVAFRVLGPLTLTTDADALVLPPSKVTCLLAALLLHPDEVVSVATLQQAIWGDDPPVSARAALQTCALRLRQLFQRHGLTSNVVRTVPGGYQITAGPQTVDLMRFRELAGRTHAEADPETELATLEEALALWSEPMLANVPSEALHRDVVPRVSEERVRVIERLCDLKIGLGRDRSVLVDLWTATRVYPANERFAARLVEVLYRTGRQADALTELRRVKEHLDNELGVGPGAGLRQLELTILRGETPTPAVAAPRPAPPASVRPPTTDAGFVGRAALCRAVADRLRGGTRIVVLSGLPGVGKTALAQHVAGLVAEDFPGGVWPVEPDAADPATQATSADGRRLLLADDVADASLARGLPTLLGPDDVLLVTSRPSLSALVARLGGWLHRVEPLNRQEALDLLGVALGADRVRAESPAAAELAALCEHLPLALRIAATRVLLRARMTLDEAVAWLGVDPVGRLSLPGDPEMSLAGRLDEALVRVGDVLADAFLRLSAAAPGTITVPDAAGLLGVDRARARELLDDLVDQSLMEEAADQYRIRGLLRRHAHGVAGRRPNPDGMKKGTLG
ncbi:BTAD domain-containing putative transcriptional regulator [Micromonospora sp. DT31]|uniref:BTAD domain-containing putative transcriptional regulator n=1 Tax=Micromonospora sp. DT31 TaxID=3393434 RepID=UPI003CF8B007